MMRIGIISPAEIAFRRFLPALGNLPNIIFAGVAVANEQEWETASKANIHLEREKAEQFIAHHGGKVFNSYQEIIESEETDALYVPLPPALHYQWAKKVLLANKHVLVEKPMTTSLEATKELLSLAEERNLALHENYMFAFHNQINVINEIINSEIIGEVRLFRISFGFPLRPSNDFRYNNKLGGGALLDCGGYTIKYASMLLGGTVKVLYAYSNYVDGYEVDIYGSAALVNEIGTTVQISFGMDNHYKCDLEVWGSVGSLKTGRVLTAPVDFQPDLSITVGNEVELRKLPADDAFMKSINSFQEATLDDTIRVINYNDILKQAHLVHEFLRRDKLSRHG
jgi:dTDP-3,4-didehydro-2,6-dideoxy-alpha-D-glucose 3-reductase